MGLQFSMRSFSCSSYHVTVVLLLAATAAGVETTTSDEVTPSLQFDEVAFASAHSAKSIHLTDTQNSIQESTFKNDVSPLPATALVQSSKKTSKNKQVLENIKSLYAYAGLAWEKAEDKDNLEQPKKQAPVLALLKHLAWKTKTKTLWCVSLTCSPPCETNMLLGVLGHTSCATSTMLCSMEKERCT